VDDSVNVEQFVDGAFGLGVFQRLSRAVAADVARHLAAGREATAAFSAAHYLVFTQLTCWSEADHRRMVDAWKAASDEDVLAGQLERAAWRYAYLYMLEQHRPPDADTTVVSALRREIDRRLTNGDLDVRTAGMCVDLLLLTSEWIPTPATGQQLVEAVSADVERRLKVGDDDVMAADRVALWLLATRAG
jgi:hypothetical protein